jgi:hypothetical protein
MTMRWGWVTRARRPAEVGVTSTGRNDAVKPRALKPCGRTWRRGVGKRAPGQPLRRERLAGIWLDKTEAEGRKISYALEIANPAAHKIGQLV